MHFGASQVAVVVKNRPASAADGSLTPGSGRSPWRRAWQPTPMFLPGESHGQRSLAGCSPWVRKELGAPEEAAHPRAGPVHFLYPVISPWTCEWLHFLAVMNNAAVSAA